MSLIFFLKNTDACVDLDECSTNSSACAIYQNSYCVNLKPFFECRCYYGYAPNGNNKLVEILELF